MKRICPRRPASMVGILFLLSILASVSADLLSAADDSSPAGLSDTDWRSIQSLYEANRHAFVPQSDGSHAARNPGQGWRMTFDGAGFEVTPDAEHWSWGLQLQRVNGRTVQSAEGKTEGQRLSYDRGHGVEEWFLNDGRGLEQGWTIYRPIGDAESLQLDLAVRGGLKPGVSPGAVTFAGQGGGSVLTYSGLKAWDAKGTALPVHFVSAGAGIGVRVATRGAQYPVMIDPLAQQVYLKASNAEAGDRFGQAVAISGDTAVVGAGYEDSNATGVNGDQTNLDADNSGAVYVFVRTNGQWVQQAYLKASNTGTTDLFGSSVAISGDTIVVGAKNEDSDATSVNGDQANNNAPQSGAAYVFVRVGTQWVQQAYLKASNTSGGATFGVSVAISGNTIVVGADGEDSASTGVNGDQSDDSGNSVGAAYVFVRNRGLWSQQAYLKASNAGNDDLFGAAVAISGDTIVVGAAEEDSVATGIDGIQADDSAPEAGAAYVFVRNRGKWTQQAYLKGSNTEESDFFGWAVAISGDTIVVTATDEESGATGVNGDEADNSLSNSGAAYVFVRTATGWAQQAYVKASNPGMTDYFGRSVAIWGDHLIVGTEYEDSDATGIDGDGGNDLAPESGAAYLYRRSGSQWTQTAFLKASNASSDDQFGTAVAISGDTAIVGAPGEASNATSFDGDQGNNSEPLAGASYGFALGPNFQSLSKTGDAAPGGTDLAFGRPLAVAVSSVGSVLFDSTLVGSGASGGRNRGVFSTFGEFGQALALQRLDDFGSLSGAGYQPGNRVVTFTRLLANEYGGILEVTLSGTGLNATNNRAILLDNGSHLSLLARTGRPISELGGAQVCAFYETLQNWDGNNLFVIRHKLLPNSTLGVSSANDSGLLAINHDGVILPATTALREGAPAFGPDAGTFGQITPLVASATESLIEFGSSLLPAGGGAALPALFETNAINSSPSRIAIRGENAPGAGTATFQSFLALGQNSTSAKFRATLAGSSSATNEGIWSASFGLLLRKGEPFDPANYPGLFVRRILRFWATSPSDDQLIAWVILGGPGVTSANNQALLLRQQDGQFLILLRTGDPAPGIGIDSVKVARLLSVEVGLFGHYAVTGVLRGTTSARNTALWQGSTGHGDDTTNRQLRLAGLVLQKGDTYSTSRTPRDVIRGLLLYPAPEPTGAGLRGLSQSFDQTGQLAVGVIGDRRVTELILLEP